MKITTKTTIEIYPSAPTKFKREVGMLLSELMKEYGVKAKDKDFEEAFKSTFKSNLYYKIDAYYNLKRSKNVKTAKI